MDSETIKAIAGMFLVILVLIWALVKWRRATVIDGIATANVINDVKEKIKPTFVCTGIMTELIEPGTFQLDGNQVNGPLRKGMTLVGPGGDLPVFEIIDSDAKSMVELPAGSNDYRIFVRDPGGAAAIIKDQLKNLGSIEFGIKE